MPLGYAHVSNPTTRKRLPEPALSSRPVAKRSSGTLRQIRHVDRALPKVSISRFYKPRGRTGEDARNSQTPETQGERQQGQPAGSASL